MQDAQSCLLESLDGAGVLTLTLNRPGQRNALDADLIGALSAALERAEGNPKVRVIVVAAEGPAFSSGHDLKEMTAHRNDPDCGEGFFRALFRQCSLMMQAIVNHRCPVIASVQGVATAAGCQLVASCDLAVASDNAQFATPGVNIGLFCSTPAVALSRNVARKQAMEMLLTGDQIGAQQAHAIGLVNRVVPAAKLKDETIALARKVAGKPAYAVGLGKKAFHKQAEMDLHGAYAVASEVMTRNMLDEDAKEGIGAFLEKRVPKWTDS